MKASFEIFKFKIFNNKFILIERTLMSLKNIIVSLENIPKKKSVLIKFIIVTQAPG